MFFGVSKSHQKDHKINTTKNEKIRNPYTVNINFNVSVDFKKVTPAVFLL